MVALTQKQQRVFDFISTTLAHTGIPPTRAEIAAALGFASPNAAQAHLRTLARKGMIELDSRRSRGIRVVAGPAVDGRSDASIELAVVGHVAAGAPILAVEHIAQRLRVSAQLFVRPADYLLKVRGDSMTEAGIFDGDLLGVKTQAEIRPDQIGVFRIDDEVTVKRFRHDNQGVCLAAANPAYPDIRIDPETTELALEGVAVGVVRSL
jgi:repressor LexA